MDIDNRILKKLIVWKKNNNMEMRQNGNGIVQIDKKTEKDKNGIVLIKKKIRLKRK